jgi:uncharacterized membrane protein YgcG
MHTRSIRPLLVGLGFAACVTLTAGTASAQSLGDRLAGVAERQAARAQQENAAKAVMLGRLLYTDISVEFEDTPARSVVEYMRTVLGINIVGRFNDDRTGTGLDPDTPINIRVQNRPALNILELFLEQAGADVGEDTTWQLRNGFVEVGTKERLGSRSARETRYYPIRDLLFEVPNFENAPDFDLDSALDQGNNGGGGGGRGGGGGGGGIGGSGGGGCGGGGRGGGGGGSGSLFGSSNDDPDRMSAAEKAEILMDLISELVEQDAWEQFGGDQARMRYFEGTLIVTAPDYVHRGISGYPFRPVVTGGAGVSDASSPVERRSVTFAKGISRIEAAGRRIDFNPKDPESAAPDEEQLTIQERAARQRAERERRQAERERAARERATGGGSGG